MSKICEVKEDIEKARRELEEALSDPGGFDIYYEKSKKLDELIEEYIEHTECVVPDMDG